MLKILSKGLICVVLAFFVAGCTVRAYSQRKDRVDQEMSGNAGYVQGAQQPVDRSDFKTTRKVYVVEFVKKDKKLDEELEAAMASKPGTAPAQETAVEKRATPMSPAPTMEEAVTEEGAGGFEEYTIQEGDTLQKISKKFYDTYRKWEKIYEANKDTLKNPNKIKPGTVIVIPKE